MTRTNIHLTARELDRLKRISDMGGLPVAELVRRAIDAYLDDFDAFLAAQKKKETKS